MLLDSGAQPLMLGKAAVQGLGLKRAEVEPCPFQIHTSLGGQEKTQYMTRQDLTVRLHSGHATDDSMLKVRAVITSAESYDVLVGGAVLYPMGFVLDYWHESVHYRPGWQSGDGRTCQLPVHYFVR